MIKLKGREEEKAGLFVSHNKGIEENVSKKEKKKGNGQSSIVYGGLSTLIKKVTKPTESKNLKQKSN